MAQLTDTDRRELWAEYMQNLSTALEPTGTLQKADLRAAIDAADTWVDANAASFNTAIPQPARGILTTAQKSWLLTSIARRRFEVGE